MEGALAQFLAFLGVAGFVIVTPGPDTALTIRNTLVGGRRGGVFTAIGVASGQAIWTVATSAGIAALIVASEPAFAAVKFAGAAYLIWLGVQSLREAIAGEPHRAAARFAAGPRLALLAALRQGVINNLGNPKMAAFFTSLLPQFVPDGGASFVELMALGLVFCSLTLAWLIAYAAVVARAGDFLGRPRIRRTVEGITGAVLIGLGLRLAAEQR